MGRDVSPTPLWERALDGHSSLASDDCCHAIPPGLIQAKAAMNRGHTLADANYLQSAIAAYTEAIQILNTLPPSQETSNSLGAALMNRGQLQHQIQGDQNPEAALADFENATTVLRSCLSEESPWPRRNLVGTLINHANILLDLDQTEEAMARAECAIATHAFANRLDPTDCELAVLAARAFCDAAGQLLPQLPPDDQEQLANLASEHVHQGLSYIQELRLHLTTEPFAEASLRLFHFGCQLQAIHKPEQLEGFIRSHTSNVPCPDIRTQLVNTATHAIERAIQTISDTLLRPTTTLEEQDKFVALSKQLGALHSELQSL